jgi:homoserine kinase type II
MAVYTHLSESQIRDHLATHYALGDFISARGIAEGVENTNYLLTTRQKSAETRSILTLFEKRVTAADLPFFMHLMAHLSARNIPCPLPIAQRSGDYLAMLEGKQSAIVSFLNGAETKRIEPLHVAEAGRLAASLHLAAHDYPGTRENALSLSGWDALLARIQPRLDALPLAAPPHPSPPPQGGRGISSSPLAGEVGWGGAARAPGLAATIQNELAHLHAHWPAALPAGVIHADLFPDNVFFNGETVSGVIDFYFACNDFWAYDLAIVLNAWCFDAHNQFDAEKARALFAAYQSIRSLTAAEISAFPLLARGAALRFFLTRAHDLLFPQEGALVTAKDPMEYLAKLTFHQNISDAKAYGL